MATIMAIKPQYSRKTKRYNVEVIVNADPLMAHGGFLIYDDAARALEHIRAGRLLQGWKPEKRAAVVAYLEASAPS